jgi:hypothetical protein
MTYTDQMARAFHSITPPRNFALQIIDHDHFLSVKADEKQFMRLLDREKREAVEYMVRVKKALEENGAIVLLVREAAE